MADAQDATILVQRWSSGDAQALDALLPLVYADLRAIAGRELRDHRGHDTLQPTALVHDVFLRLLGGEQPRLMSRAHLFNTAAKIMRQLLVDRARRAASEKHGGAWRRRRLHRSAEPADPGKLAPARTRRSAARVVRARRAHG